MNVTTPDGRVIGRVDLTPTDVAALAHGVGAGVESRVRALIASQRAAIATGGGWTPGPRPAADTAREDIPTSPRRRRWWPWVAGALFALALIGYVTDEETDTGAAAPTSTGETVTVAPQPADAPRAVPAADGSILVGTVVVDNVFDRDSPLRSRFAGVLISHGVAGTSGTELDANVRDGVTFCRDLAVGNLTAQRHADVVTGTADAATSYGVGKQRRAVVTAALSTLCPAL
ncbi:hypothetical protein SEA_NOSILAM_86 [Gordonia phage NosilaM]|uniref:DUF732 domain-containing protein n=1 Tax=Gordonia phage NosilaM TaxID=2507863 RepID=A0A410TE73_9CAUD|nr:membrane protein [Gordonia phage NosilaM]QAU07327.1 hypothetical protein SEA_NOSILAM_86 [Gordonia phage NosilaM]